MNPCTMNECRCRYVKLRTCMTCEVLATRNDEDERTLCGITDTTSEIIVCKQKNAATVVSKKIWTK